MTMTELEKTIIKKILADPELKPVRSSVNFNSVKVNNRNMSASGFLSEFEQSEELKLFDTSVSLRWGKIGAKLNASHLDTGYLVYVDNGYVTAVEGFTYGNIWPDHIDRIEFYEVKMGNGGEP